MLIFLFQDQIDSGVKILLQLKAEYKSAIGKDWKPGPSGATIVKAEPVNTSGAPQGNMADSGAAGDLKAKIDAQGAKVRDVKAAKAAKVGNSLMRNNNDKRKIIT